MFNTKSPCGSCKTRHTGCHSECEMYAAFRKKCDAVKSARRSQYEYDTLGTKTDGANGWYHK